MKQDQGKKVFKPLYDKEWLEKKYLDEDMNYPMIAKILGCANSTVQKWINKHQIPRKPMGAALKGDKNGRWKGGKYKSKAGYIQVRHDENHPRAKRASRYTSYVAQHYLVMEKYLGRYLALNETVHHRNGIKDDNRIENLKLFNSQKEHHQHEQKILSFAKQLIWGDLCPELKVKLQNLFKLSRND